jgi:hypothetical protein
MPLAGLGIPGHCVNRQARDRAMVHVPSNRQRPEPRRSKLSQSSPATTGLIAGSHLRRLTLSAAGFATKVSTLGRDGHAVLDFQPAVRPNVGASSGPRPTWPLSRQKEDEKCPTAACSVSGNLRRAWRAARRPPAALNRPALAVRLDAHAGSHRLQRTVRSESPNPPAPSDSGTAQSRLEGPAPEERRGPRTPDEEPRGRQRRALKDARDDQVAAAPTA